MPLGLVQLFDGLYASISPRGFYDDFPFGRGWVADYPQYSEHLVRDVGGLFLGTGVLLLLAAAWMRRRVVLAAVVSFLMFAVPHTTFHLLNLEGDAAINAVALTAMVLGPLLVLALLLRPDATTGGTGRLPGGARIALVDKPKGPVARMTFAISKRRLGTVMDPARAFAHTPLLLAGYGTMEMLAERSHHADERLKELAVMRAAMLTGCEWCLDFGTAEMIAKGIPEEDLRELARYRDSARFSDLEKLVLDYATGMTRTPVDVSDELVAQLREHLDDAAIVELTNIVALENLRARFNWGLGIGSQGFTDGAYCVAPEPAVTAAS